MMNTISMNLWNEKLTIKTFKHQKIYKYTVCTTGMRYIYKTANLVDRYQMKLKNDK
jgi:hypothetical protein